MNRFIILILAILTPLIYMKADPNWRLHTSFDEEVKRVVETPNYVYFTSRTLPASNKIEVYHSLFRYDKEGDELIGLSTDNILNGTVVKDIQYNPKKGYLIVIYPDYNIDLLYEDGSMMNIPYYKMASISAKKSENSISIDPGNDRFYIATDFGYVAFNDKKGEISESRIYSSPLKSFIRVGDRYFAIHEDKIISAPADDPRLNLDAYEIIYTNENLSGLYPLGDKRCLIYESGDEETIRLLNLENSEITDIYEGNIYNIENNREGLSFVTSTRIFLVSEDGEVNIIERPENYRQAAASSYDGTEFWQGLMRKGLTSLKRSSDGWKLTRDYMAPNAPSPFICTDFAMHPSKGLLALSYGFRPQTSSYPVENPVLLSSYSNGRWKNHSPAYTNPEQYNIALRGNGMAVDPQNSSWVYVTSPERGIARLNLDDPKDLIHLSRENDPTRTRPGFIPIVPAPTLLGGYTNFSPPRFDSKGNLWMIYFDWDDQTPDKIQIYCWTPSDRLSTTSSSNYVLPTRLTYEAPVLISNTAYLLPLTKSGNGLLVYTRGGYDEKIVLINTNGTPLDASDDNVMTFDRFIDSDGNEIIPHSARFLWEDPYSGNVWVGHDQGLFYFSPSNAIKGSFTPNRVKVSRNDGTNLADYLFDGVSVNAMTSDSENRKWFGTGGAGLVCTSYDCREIIMEFTTENSPLPSDNILGLAYNSADNSIMISTENGLAEYFLPANYEGSEKTDIRVYPNPVRPDFTGYVTITDIPENSLVKIVDAAGNLVKELGRMTGFEMKWDISNIEHKRVPGGVYYIMVSPGDEVSKFSAAGKILIIS